MPNFNLKALLALSLILILTGPRLGDCFIYQPQILSDISYQNIYWQLNNITSYSTRRAGTLEGNMSAEYIYNYLRSFNISACHEYFETPDGTLINIIADIPGSGDPIEYIVLGAHYDSISDTSAAPGTNDNGGSVAVLMEIGRLLADCNLTRSVKIIFFGGEEIGRYGSLNWINRHIDIRNTLAATLILDMVAYGHHLVLDYNGQSKPLAEYILQSSGFSSYLSIEENYYLSDHRGFWSANIPAVLLHHSDPTSYPYYHRATDTIDKLNLTNLYLAANITLEAAYNLATDSNLINIYQSTPAILYPILIVSSASTILMVIILTARYKRRKTNVTDSS